MLSVLAYGSTGPVDALLGTGGTGTLEFLLRSAISPPNDCRRGYEEKVGSLGGCGGTAFASRRRANSSLSEDFFLSNRLPEDLRSPSGSVDLDRRRKRLPSEELREALR
jgi:hypothetical protein